MAGLGFNIGDKLINFGENLVGGIVDNAEAIAEGTVDLVLPDKISSKLKTDYIKSFIVEMLPIFIFVVYYFYYQQMLEYHHKWNYLW